MCTIIFSVICTPMIDVGEDKSESGTMVKDIMFNSLALSTSKSIYLCKYFLRNYGDVFYCCFVTYMYIMGRRLWYSLATINIDV